MQKKSRKPTFQESENIQIVYLRAQRFTYAYVAMKLGTGRSVRSIQTQHHRLEKSGDAAAIRADLIKLGTLGAGA